MITDAFPALYKKSATGESSGTPFKIDTNVPDIIKDTFVLYIEDTRATAANLFGVDPTPYKVEPMALHIDDCRIIVLQMLRFIASTGDKVAKDIIQRFPLDATS
jgi:hypothetical protein